MECLWEGESINSRCAIYPVFCRLFGVSVLYAFWSHEWWDISPVFLSQMLVGESGVWVGVWVGMGMNQGICWSR